MQQRKFNVVTDGQYGSCGKGLVASTLAWKHRPEILSNTNMANAGHVAVWTDGQKFTAKALPSPAMLRQWTMGQADAYKPHVIVGASAAFNLDQLIAEMDLCGVQDHLSIHPRAGVITTEHRIAEAGDGESSTKHLASTMQGCGTFLADKVLRKKDLRLARDYTELKRLMTDYMARKLDLPTADQASLLGLGLPELLHTLMNQHGFTILHEGSQGFSLDVNHGSHYPQCTSRGTTAMQNMADMGISPRDLGDVYLVIRPYPIRVGNIQVEGKQIGYSGDCYEDQHEVSWQQVADEAGMPQEEAAKLLTSELTTVTKRLRRVFTFSDRQLKEAALVNGATRVALNFANYIDWNVSGVNEYNKLTPKVKDFIRKVEDITKLPVTIIGTGPRVDQVVML